MTKRTLITCALPYANGPVHLGHALEHIQADVYVRFLRSCGEDVVFLCAEDTHGTPIELRAREQGQTPEAFIQRFYDEHQADFAGLGISYDAFHTTHSPENRHYAELIYGRLKAAGDIEAREVEQAYCEKDERFLPDRFIRGTCPNCKAEDQYGDVCERCSKVYASTDLINPRCGICGTPPVRRRSAHLFFRLSRHADALKALLARPGFVDPGIAKQLEQFFERGLADWDISRDGPYFGFPIPGETNKFFYVWLDAPIGYIATTEKWAKTTGRAQDALAYWGDGGGEGKGERATLLHCIGKDIVYFHVLFWPAMLKVAGLRQPDRIIVHGFLTVDGVKMSKTRGTFITIRKYLDTLDPTYLRYFLATNLGPGPEDVDLGLTEFRLRVNAELVNNIGNLANRTLSLLKGQLGGRLSPTTGGPGRAVVDAALARVSDVRAAYAAMDFRQATRLITAIGQSANQYLNERAPWKALRQEPEAARADLSDAAELVYVLGALLAPIVPSFSERLFAQLAAPPLTFAALDSARYPLLDRSREIGEPAPLLSRLEEAQVAGLVAPADAARPAADSKAADPKGAAVSQPAAAPSAPASSHDSRESEGSTIEYEDFARIELRVGKVVSAERVPKATQLLKLTVDVGEAEGPRTIAAGIAEAYAPEQLLGRSVVVVTNLKPRTIRGIASRGMLLAAGPGGKDLSLVDPGAMPAGTFVK